MSVSWRVDGNHDHMTKVNKGNQISRNPTQHQTKYLHPPSSTLDAAPKLFSSHSFLFLKTCPPKRHFYSSLRNLTCNIGLTNHCNHSSSFHARDSMMVCTLPLLCSRATVSNGTASVLTSSSQLPPFLPSELGFRIAFQYTSRYLRPLQPTRVSLLVQRRMPDTRPTAAYAVWYVTPVNAEYHRGLLAPKNCGPLSTKIGVLWR